MAATTKRPRSLFGEILRRTLEEQGVSNRELARRLTIENPARLENTRRALIRYIRGEVTPSDQARDAIAKALGLDPAAFAAQVAPDPRREVLYAAVENLVDALMHEISVRQLDAPQ